MGSQGAVATCNRAHGASAITDIMVQMISVIYVYVLSFFLGSQAGRNSLLPDARILLGKCSSGAPN